LTYGETANKNGMKLFLDILRLARRGQSPAKEEGGWLCQNGVAYFDPPKGGPETSSITQTSPSRVVT
jgi:hypothetical protein